MPKCNHLKSLIFMNMFLIQFHQPCVLAFLQFRFAGIASTVSHQSSCFPGNQSAPDVPSPTRDPN